MKIVVNGRVVSSEGQRGIFGTTVEIFDRHPSLKQSKPLQGQITNRSGEFSFRLGGKALERYRKNQATFFVRAVDAKGKALSESVPLEIEPDQTNIVELTVDAKMLSEVTLPRQPKAERIVPIAVFNAIDAVIQSVAAPSELEGRQILARNFYCSLPPIQELDTLLDLGYGVLEGRPEDMLHFQAYLDNLALWNLRNNAAPRLQLDPAQAEYLLSEEFLSAYQDKIDAHHRTRPRTGIVPVQHLLILQAAAIRTAGGNTMQIHRNLGIVSEQVCGLSNLDRLYQAALDTQPEDSTLFVQMLDILGGNCGPGGGQGLFSRGPAPIPCESPFWPPDPENPVPFGSYIPEDDLCWVEGVIKFPKILEEEQTYIIESITPERACPGQVITIRGTGFEFEGRAPEVFFASHPRGTKIRAVPTWTSPTAIQVVVPEGAVCGELELRIPDALAATVLVCDQTIDLLHGPQEPFRFEGGETLITSFRLPLGAGCGISSGALARFEWHTTCNTDSVTLTLRDSTGDVLATFSDLNPNLPFEAPLPTFSKHTFVSAELLAQGPCGEDRETILFLVRRVLADPSTIVLTRDCVSNWHGNIVRNAAFTLPADLDGIVDVVHAAGVLGKRLGTIGSLWSYSNCVSDGAIDRGCEGRPRRNAPDWLIKTECSFELRDGSVDVRGCEICDVIPFALMANPRMILEGELLSEFTPAPSPGSMSMAGTPAPLPLVETPCTPAGQRLIHVKAGIKLAHLNCLLDNKGLAMPTLGGSNGQSLAGAISTGTHGTNVRLPPIQDFVRAIHLIGPGGKQFWIEPRAHRITDREKMEHLKEIQVLDPCMEIIYEDSIFDACLVSVGAAGIIYSVVLEAAPEHHLRSTTQSINYVRAREIITNDILGSAPPFFAEFVLGPNGVVLLTTRQPVHAADEERLEDSPAFTTLMGVWLVDQILNRAIPAIPLLVNDLTALLTTAGPFVIFIFEEVNRRVRFLWNLHAGLIHLVELLQNPHHPDEVLENAAIDALNLIWDLRTVTFNGRQVVEEFQNKFARTLRPLGMKTKKSYEIYNDQTDCTTMKHPTIMKRIQSYEYIMPATEVLSFVDRVQALAESVKAGPALILIVNLRFTKGTRASLGMQQFDQTGYVELWTIRGIAGSDEFHRRLEEMTRDMDVIPHWGHYHQRFEGGREKDFSDVYLRLEEWQDAMNFLAEGADGDPNTFRHGFVRDRNLLPDL
jgi:hypothetical protein